MRSFAWLSLLLVGCGGASQPGIDSLDETGGAGGELSSGGASSDTGGVSGGSTESGGAPTGGVATGGASTGGSASGGVSTGGAVTGGSSSGGATSGGSGSGGAPDADGDGVPDSSDECPGHDDDQDLNENGDPDLCEPGWCREDSDPEEPLCTDYGVRQGFCAMQEWSSEIGPGECVRCSVYTYDCNEDPSDGCEVFSTGAHPCFPS